MNGIWKYSANNEADTLKNRSNVFVIIYVANNGHKKVFAWHLAFALPLVQGRVSEETLKLNIISSLANTLLDDGCSKVAAHVFTLSWHILI